MNFLSSAYDIQPKLGKSLYNDFINKNKYTTEWAHM